MRIAIVSPLIESVPPKTYGGTERVVAYLADELLSLGHDVVLYASGDSTTSARLVPICPKALRLCGKTVDSIAHHLVLSERVLRDAADYDVVHFHSGYLHFSLTRFFPVPTLTTLHGRLDLADLVPLAQTFRDVPVASISDAQRQPLPFLNWQGTVYNGLPEDLLPFRDAPGDYLAFLGRISPEKRPDHAIEIAERAGMKLVIAAKVDAADEAYFHREIKPLLSHPMVEFVGEVDDRGKSEILGGARALLFPIDWPEPFGLVMIESMACGTPVIAFNHGSVPEVMEEGVTGFLVSGIAEAVRATQRIGTLDRRSCRAQFERRFTSRMMAEGYLALYQQLQSRPGQDEVACRMTRV